MSARPIRGAIQRYAWGDRTFIPGLLGVEPDDRPWAELWLGTHPGGPARFADGQPLRDVTGELPYLLKVLAAAEPLSLQAHPDAAQARAGHGAGRYPDDQAKPELLCALTPFEAFCGIRPVAATRRLLEDMELTELASLVDGSGPGVTLARIYRGDVALDAVVDACRRHSRPEATWVTRLAARHPGDPSVVATLLLNHVTLQPGQTMRLTPRHLHAYLGGAGIELMGASDNVVRGGLTDKPVDVDDFLRTFDPTPLDEPVMPPADEYELPGTAVRLLSIAGPATHRSASHELAVTTAGRTTYVPAGAELDVADGETAYVASPGVVDSAGV